MILVKNLTKKYASVAGLDNLSLKVRGKKIFALVGPNGAGKSSLLNILTGLINKTSGEVTIFNFNLDKEVLKIKSKIGVVPEIFPLFEGLTAYEHLEFVSKVYNLKTEEYKKRITELLNFFELSFVKNRTIETYSQGMKKKLTFASAIIHNPELLFLDEPFENVDPISRKKMKNIIEKFKNNGATVVIASHSLVEVEDFCDEVAIIDKGKIIFQSEIKEIRKKVKNELTNETYASLEEIFLELTTEKKEEKTLSWL